MRLCTARLVALSSALCSVATGCPLLQRRIQRPTNENTNRLIREFFPKGTRFDRVTDEQVEEAVWLLNNRPRKVLGRKFPAEAMQEVLLESAMTT